MALLLSAAMSAAFRAIGPPFDLFALAPASVLATPAARRSPTPVTLALLATAYCAALAIALIPPDVSDSFGGFRTFGLVAYAEVGVLWAAVGVAVLRSERH